MVEQDAIAREQAIALAIIHRHPMSVQLSCSIRTARLERRVLVLRAFRITVHLAAGGLVELGLHTRFSNRFEQPHCSKRGDLARVFRYVEAHPDMTLRAEVVDFIRSDGADDLI